MSRTFFLSLSHLCRGNSQGEPHLRYHFQIPTHLQLVTHARFHELVSGHCILCLSLGSSCCLPALGSVSVHMGHCLKGSSIAVPIVVPPIPRPEGIGRRVGTPVHVASCVGWKTKSANGKKSWYVIVLRYSTVASCAFNLISWTFGHQMSSNRFCDSKMAIITYIPLSYYHRSALYRPGFHTGAPLFSSSDCIQFVLLVNAI